MTTQTWTNIIYITVLVFNTITLISSHRFGMMYYNNCMNTLKEILKLRMEGKIDGETHTRLLDAISKYSKKNF